jgi:hypothetical protein
MSHDMRTRHKVPSVFNLYMVDVLCCALGCVILVWQLDLDKVKDNEKKTAEARATAEKRLADTERDRAAALAEIDRARADLVRLSSESASLVASLEAENAKLKGSVEDREARLRTAEKKARDDADAAAKALAAAIAAGERKLKQTESAADKRAADLEAARAALEKKATGLGSRLTDADAMLLDLATQLAAADRRNKDLKLQADLVPGLQGQLRLLTERGKESEAKLAEKGRLFEDLMGKKAAADTALKRQGEELALARSFETKWKAAEERLTLLAKEVASSRTALADADRDMRTLRAAKQTLETEVFRVRQAADNRFAGITLTGRNVVFLVDMSGSMELVDEKTEAPEKWSGVRNTLLKIMNSLPDLEKFQVIVFEEKTAFLLGKPDEWIDFDRKTSPLAVEAALKAVKPKGGTDMYAAFQAAFKFRPRGLDTIYLFSDGLPNAGEGVPVAEAKRLLDMGREPELSDRLAKHIRRTMKTNWNRDTGTDRVRINAVGFFYESPDVGAFLWALARENEGSFVGMSRP